MKLVKGQALDYPMPPYSMIELVVVRTGDRRIDPKAFDIALSQVRQEEIRSRPESQSMPTMFATYFDGHDKLMFWPTPDKDYEVIVRFAGPLQEI